MPRTYYLYRHIRHDKNEPFYIGRGVVDEKDCRNEKRRYHRAYSLRRNIFWKRIVAKTEYDVEIMWETESGEEIMCKEIEFIKLYGRSDLKQGSLCNLTDGGDGSLRMNSDVLDRIHRTKIIGGANNRVSEVNSKAVYVYDLGGKYLESFRSRTMAELALDVNETSMRQSLQNKVSTWKYFFSDIKYDKLDLTIFKLRKFKNKNNEAQCPRLPL